jgi:hypothetical protein
VPTWGLYGRFNRAAPAALHLSGRSDCLGCLRATRSIFSLTESPGRAAWVIRKGVAPSGVLSGEGSFDGPYNIALEPSRPTPGAILSLRRAAQRER